MKKFLLVVITILPTLLTAQNGITISNFAVSGGSVTFNISWNKVGMPTLWLDSAWVFVDYNNAGTMTRLPLLPGATLTAPSAQGTDAQGKKYGIVIEEAGNNQGVWVAGNAREAGNFSATVKLPFSGSNVSGACVYASNYPPLGTWNNDMNRLSIVGTPPYTLTLQLKSSAATETVISGSPYILSSDYTLVSFTDKTGAPGLFNCTPPTAPTSLTASSSTICSGASVTLTATGGSDGSGAQFEWGTGTVGVGGTLTSSNTYLVSPTSTTTYWVRRVSTDGCGTTTAATRTVTVTPNNTYTLAYGSTNTSATVSVAMTSIVYNTTGATGVSVTGLPTGVTAAYNSNQVTISGTPSTAGTFNYTITLTGGCGTIQASGKITVAVNTPQYAASTQTWSISCSTPQTWSAPIKVPACSGTAFTDSYSVASCRNAWGYANSGYFYNWTYVNNNASSLCPSPWRVPTNTDFINLDKCLGGTGTNFQSVNGATRYESATWGGAMSGFVYLGDLYYPGQEAVYWSSTPYTSTEGYNFAYTPDLVYVNNYGAANSQAYQVRCVK